MVEVRVTHTHMHARTHAHTHVRTHAHTCTRTHMHTLPNNTLLVHIKYNFINDIGLLKLQEIQNELMLSCGAEVSKYYSAITGIVYFSV